MSQIGQTYSFLGFWNLSIPSRLLTNVIFSIIPPLSHGKEKIYTNDRSIILQINQNTSYNMTVTAYLCTNESLSQTYILGKNFFKNYLCLIYSHYKGKCPFLLIPAIEVVYEIFRTGSYYSIVRCINHEQVILHCGENERWQNDTTAVCKSPIQNSK